MNNDLQLLAMMVQTAGRGRDTVLAHITPKEALLLKLMGGRGSVNPQTGLLEFADDDDDFGSDRNQQERSDLERDLQASERTASDEEDAAFGADLTAAGGGLGALDGPEGVDYGVAFGPEEQSFIGKILDFLGLGSIEDFIQTAVSVAAGLAFGPAVGALTKSAIGANLAGRVVGAAVTGGLSRAAGNLALQAAEEAGLVDESPKTIAARELGVGGAGFRGAVGGGIGGALGGAFGPDLAGSIARGGLGRFATETAIGAAPESIGGRGLSFGDAVSRGVPEGVSGAFGAALTEALGGGFAGRQASSSVMREINRVAGDAASRGISGVVGRDEASGGEVSQPRTATITDTGSQRQPSNVRLSPATLSALSIRPDIGGRGVTIFGGGDSEGGRRSPWNSRSLRVKDNLGVTDE
jgi:hypothetical protein